MSHVKQTELEEAIEYINAGVNDGWIAPEDFKDLTDEELVRQVRKLQNNMEDPYQDE